MKPAPRLIISGASEESTDKYYKVNRIIPKLEKGEEMDTAPGEPKILTGDFVVDEKHRNITVTDEGWEKSRNFSASATSPIPKTGRSTSRSKRPSKPTRSIARTSSTW